MFVMRLVIGLLKGLVIGALVGYGLAAAGLAVPGAAIAYPVAAIVGILVALIAGKPIWAKDARIEVGMKAAAGALLAPGLLWLARRFLGFEIPFDLSTLPGLKAMSSPATFGMFSATSMAAVAALLAAFFDADNQPGAQEEPPAKGGAAKQRVATSAPKAEAADALDLDGVETDGAEEQAAEQKGRK
jgi:hypothetical protein